MKRPFRDFRIQRTCTKSYKDYHRYTAYLQKDFQHRCAYCNLLDTQITTPPEVDHFVPRDAFQDEWPELETEYKNLVYSCKKCNLAKSDQFKGDLKKRIIENELFYNPEKTDYATIFYRDDVGSICSEDDKGNDMINRLKLYRPIHNLAWLCEITSQTIEKLNKQIEKTGKESERGKLLISAKSELVDYYITCRDIFIANYNNKKFAMK